MMPHVTTRKPVSKACDACRRRKIKCNGPKPCAKCRDASLACTFDAPRGQGDRSGARATVLNELRARSGCLESTSGVLQSLSLPIEASTPVPPERVVLDRCMAAYVAHVYPVVPLLDIAVVEAQASQVNIAPASQRFVRPFCAYVINFGRVSESPELDFSTKASRSHLLDLAMSSRNAYGFTQPSPLSVYVSFFLYGASAGQGDY